MLCDKKVLNDQLMRMQNGDDNAFEELYRYSEKLIYTFILSITGDTYIADDVKQDTYIAVYRNIDSYKPYANPLAWMIQISKNIAINVLRKNSHIDLTTPLAMVESSPSDNTEQNDYIVYLLNKLDKISRQIVMLHLVGGYKHKEIAHILGIPVTTVHWRYQAALKKINKIYEQEAF